MRVSEESSCLDVHRDVHTLLTRQAEPACCVGHLRSPCPYAARTFSPGSSAALPSRSLWNGSRGAGTRQRARTRRTRRHGAPLPLARAGAAQVDVLPSLMDDRPFDGADELATRTRATSSSATTGSGRAALRCRCGARADGTRAVSYRARELAWHARYRSTWLARDADERVAN
jgi:hypothetical protein